MATITKRQTRGKMVWGAQIRRKGHPTLSATFERLPDARQWAARQEATISAERAVPGRAARQPKVAHLIDRYRATILPNKRPKTMINQHKHLSWRQEAIGHLRLSEVTKTSVKLLALAMLRPGSAQAYSCDTSQGL